MKLAQPLIERENAQEILAKLPKLPGVYFMKDQEGRILYIGKAINLCNRVRSYFRKPTALSRKSRPAEIFLHKKVYEVETVVTQSEREALILENTLIKKHKPKYNVELRDGKTFLGVRISVQHSVPRLMPIRKIQKDGAKYFGPFASAYSIRQVIRLLQKVFGLRVCSDTFFRNRTRPCIEYQIGRCLGPCVEGLVTEQEYQKAVRDTIRFLQGQSEEVMQTLTRKMEESSEKENFEDAIKYRNQLEAIETTLAKQVVASHRREEDEDIYGLYRTAGFCEIYILFVRGGQVVGGESFDLGNIFGEDQEILQSFLWQRYGHSPHFHSLPRKILLPVALSNRSLFVDALCERAGGKRRLKILVPKKGERRRLLKMAQENAKANFQRVRRNEKRNKAILEQLKKKLHLPKLPFRLECYDISNFQGKHAVGSMVVFSGTEPNKKAYRHFKIKNVKGINDYQMLHEVLSRRFKNDEPLPDLLLVDGGKGQLQIAKKVMEEIQLQGIPLAALAKARTLSQGKGKTEERIFLPGRSNAVTFRPGSGALFLLQRIRDEAHRFAITHHRKLRNKSTLLSVLEEVPGIGPKKRKQILELFGSLDRIKESTVEELQSAGLNKSLAQRILEKLNQLN